MSIFSDYASPRQEDTYVPYFDQPKPTPQLFFGGSLSTGFYPTTEAPDPTAEQGQQARTYTAAVQGGKNWTTAGAWLVSELGLGNDASYVNRDAAMVNQQLLAQPGERVESVGVGAAFADTLLAVKEVVDPNFKVESTFEQWKKDNQAAYAVFQQRGVADENFTKNVTNKVYFDANIRLQQGLVNAADVIDARNSKVTGIQQAWESTRGVLDNYVLNDPVGLGVNVIPVAGQVKYLAQGAKVAEAARLSLLGRSVVALSRARGTEAMLLSKTGQLALSTVEMSLIGMADDTVFQTQEIARTQALWAGTDQALDYSFTRTAIAGAAGMALNLGLHGATKGLGATLSLALDTGDRLMQRRQAALVAHGASPNAAVARGGASAYNIARDYAADAVKIKIAQHLDNMSPNVTADPGLGWIMDDKILQTAGLTSEDVLATITQLSDIMGDREINNSHIHSFMQEWFVQAKGFNESRGFQISEGPQAVHYRSMVDRIESRIIAEGGVQPTDRTFIPGTREFRERVRDEVFSALKKEEGLNLRIQAERKPLHPDSMKSSELAMYMADNTLHKENDLTGRMLEAEYHQANINMLGNSKDDFVQTEIPLDRFSFSDETAAGKEGQFVADSVDAGSTEGFMADVEKMKGLDPRTAPPIVAGRLDADLQVIDGRHRIFMARQRGDKTIKAYIPKSLAKELGLTEMNTPTRMQRLQKEFKGWLDEANKRDLLLDEEARMMALEQTLGVNNALPEGYKVNPTLPKKREVFTMNKMKPESESAKVFRKLLKEQQTLKDQTELLAKAKTIPGTDTARLVKDRDNTLARIRRVVDTMQGTTEVAPPKLSEVLRDMATNPPTTSGERTQVLVKMLQSSPEERGLRVQDIHTAAQIMRAWGMGENVANLLLQKTGQMNGTRSMFASVRELFDFLDHTSVKVEDVSPGQRQHVGTLADKKRESSRLMREMDQTIEKHLKSGKVADWDRTQLELVLHGNGAIESTDPIVLDIFAAWEKAQKQYMQEGLANGYLGRMTKEEQKARFFPRRWQVGLVRRNSKDFQGLLYETLLKKWKASDTLHNDTMVALGWAKRTEVDGRIDWEGAGLFDKQPLPKKKSELDPALLPVYEKGLTSAVNQNGENALQQSAWRAVNHILSEDTPKINQVTGKIIREDVTRAASEIEKRLPVELIQDLRVHKFLDTNVMDIAQQYAESTGFAIKAQTAVQQKWGVAGATLDDWMDAVKIAADGQFRGDADAVEKLQQGISTFRTKYLRMRGKSGSLMSVNENILENMAEVGTSLGSAMFTGGISVLSMFADTWVAAFAKIHSPADFFRQIKTVFQSIFQHKSMMKEHLYDLHMGSYIHRHGNIERYTSGQLGSSFTYSWGSRMANPWKEVTNAFSGKTQGATGVNNRAVLGSMRAMEAVAKNVSTLFGGDFWFTSAAAAQVAGLKRETAQYLDAAITMAKELEQGGWDDLAQVEMKATADALAKNMSRADAIRVGQTARGKAFNLVAREAGFGPNWHIPLRMNQHGLLDFTKLSTLQKAGELTGGIRTKGLKSFTDVNTLVKAMDRLTPEEQINLQEGIRGFHNMMEADAHKIMNVPGILQTPTDPSSRVYLGRMMNMYTGYMRTFASNHVLGLANVPQRRGMALITGFLIGETLARTARRLLNGEPWSEIEAQWEENPKLMMARTLMQVPFFGEWTMAPQLLMEAGLNGPLWKQDSGSVPAGALNDMFQLAREGANLPYSEAGETPRALTHADRVVTRLLPGLGLARSMMGADMSRDQSKQYKRARAIMERNDLNWEQKNNWDDTQVDTSKGTIYGPSVPGVLP